MSTQEAKEVAVFETQNVDLAAFLLFEGEELLECKRDDSRRKVVIMRFIDKYGKCRDLERVFINSDFKKYRDLHKWLLSRIHEKLRD